MKRRLSIRAFIWTAFAAVALLSLTAGAEAVQPEIKKIRLYDNCEPTSFNAAFGDGTCVGSGTTTVNQFIAELTATQTATAWRNQPTYMKLHIGRPTQIENRGGEVHTFTQVAEFGGGLVPDLNNLSGNPIVAPECEDLGTVIFIPAGATLLGPVTGNFQLPLGVHKFQCCIHPWMRTLIQVEPNTTTAQTNTPSADTGHHSHH